MSSVRVPTENQGESALVGMVVFDAAEAAAAAELIRPCCASTRWICEVVSGRPYGAMRRLLSASDDVISDLRWTDLSEALAAHPGIAERSLGIDDPAVWARREQPVGGDQALVRELIENNLAYEQRFGHAFLICAAGRGVQAVLDELRLRLRNSTHAERTVVREELRAIVRLRLIKTLR